MRDFIKYALASVVGFALFSALSFGSLIAIIVAIASRDAGPEVEDKTILVLDLGVNIADTQPTLGTEEALERALVGDGERILPLRMVLRSLEAAATDDRIVGLYIKGTPGSMPTGQANLEEVRNAIDAFRASEKPIYAYDRDWTESEYYLASAATLLMMDPLGAMEFNGIASEVMFLGEAFDRYGVGVQVVRAGAYKSAIEPFTRSNFSDEARSQLQGTVEDLWRELRVSVAANRPIDAVQLQTLASSRGILLAQEAVNAQVIDEVATDNDVVQKLQELSEVDEEDKPFRGMSISEYANTAEIFKDELEIAADDNRIAIIYARGPIVDGEGGLQQIGGDSFAKIFRKLRQEEDVKAIVLRIDSPGGSALASEVIKRELELTKEVKPVIVSMGNVAASGGYWIAMSGDRIYANPNTITGSIGVFGLLLNVQELANEYGINWDVVKTNPLADLESLSRPKTAREIQILQNFVNLVYERFITEVARTRNMERSQVEDIAQGKIWSGTAARDIGLVDELGGLDVAVNAAAERAELGEDWVIEEYPKASSFEIQLLENLFGSDTNDPLSQQWQQVREQVQDLATFNDPSGVYSKMPYRLELR